MALANQHAHAPVAPSPSFTSLDELALSSTPVTRRGIPPLRTLSSLDGVGGPAAEDDGAPQQRMVGVLRVSRLRRLRRLAKRIYLACTSSLRRPADPVEPASAWPPDPQQDSCALVEPGLVLLLDNQEQLGDLPEHLRYDPVLHADVDVRAYLYITDEVWRCMGEQAARYYIPPWRTLPDAGRFYLSVLYITDEVKCILPPTLERDHSINTMRKLARDMMNNRATRWLDFEDY
ncbi:hypothetical protein JCM9279_006439 [Rhodotorula babjevae]